MLRPDVVEHLYLLFRRRYPVNVQFYFLPAAPIQQRVGAGDKLKVLVGQLASVIGSVVVMTGPGDNASIFIPANATEFATRRAIAKAYVLTQLPPLEVDCTPPLPTCSGIVMPIVDIAADALAHRVFGRDHMTDAARDAAATVKNTGPLLLKNIADPFFRIAAFANTYWLSHGAGPRFPAHEEVDVAAETFADDPAPETYARVAKTILAGAGLKRAEAYYDDKSNVIRAIIAHDKQVVGAGK